MTRSYVVVWRGKTCVTYYDGDGWSLDPMRAKLYASRTVATARSFLYRHTYVAEAWS